MKTYRITVVVAILVFSSLACALMPMQGGLTDEVSNDEPIEIPVEIPEQLIADKVSDDDPDANLENVESSKWDLWQSGTRLRGANIYQRRVFPELDGTEYIGPGPFGPPYTQADLDHLSEMGSNYVNISGPGLFTVVPPYQVDREAVENLDRLLEMAEKADLFAVLTFRTGPGRSEFAILGPADWLPDEYIIETVWEDETAREAWAEMWKYTAERYKDNKVVVGYDLMCEPNANAVLDIWDPEEFYNSYAGTGYDWNSWYPNLVIAIREADPDTPILVGGNSYSEISWLPYLQTVEDPYVVYTIHQYAPHEYTHQEIPDPIKTYPGSFDTNYDGEDDEFDRSWLENTLAIAVAFQQEYDAVVAVNEFGIVRWAPRGSDFLRDQMDLYEKFGWNYSAWQWHASWKPLVEGDNLFNFLYGPNPMNVTETDNEVLDAYREAWGRNEVFPSGISDR
jgi:heme-degrading monooxygenase HmoA